MSYLEERWRWFCIQLLRIFKLRCFIATRYGRIKIGPLATNVGDEVWVFFYCPRPYVLRRGSSTYYFVGEAYIHGLIYGQALDMLDRREVKETHFVLE